MAIQQVLFYSEKKFFMKIGLDASRYGSENATGVEKYSKEIIDHIIEFASKEDEISLYSANETPFPKRDNIQNIVIPGKRFWTLYFLSKYLYKNKPEALFVPSHTFPLILPKNAVITIHDTAFVQLKNVYSAKQYYYLMYSTKFAVKKASRIIVPSIATKNDLMKHFNCPEGKIRVVTHGFKAPRAIDKEKTFKESQLVRYFGLTEETPFLLFVGRLESKKNLVKLIQAFAVFSKSHPKYRLVLAGMRGVGFERILKAFNESEVKDKIIMPGYITEEEKQAFFHYCRAFVYPSLYEGFGLPILEAFYFEKPVITSKISSIPEVGGDAVEYFDPYDSTSIYNSIEKVVSNEKLANELTKKGVERLAGFSWEDAAKSTLNIIHGQ